MKVMIVEDDPILQLDIADAIRDMGYDLMGPFGGEAQAIAAIDAEVPAAAIIDFNLGPGADSGRLAARLVEEGVRFAFVTGHGRDHLPDEFAEVPLIVKPYRMSQLSHFIKTGEV